MAHIFQNQLSQSLPQPESDLKFLIQLDKKYLFCRYWWSLRQSPYVISNQPLPPSDRRPEYITKLAHFELNRLISTKCRCGLKQMEFVNNFSNDAKEIFLQLFFLTIVQINACMCLTFFLGETLNLPSQSLTLCSQRHTEHRIVAVMIVISTECALTRLLTNDDHPSYPLFALHRPERHKMTLEKLGRPPMN